MTVASRLPTGTVTFLFTDIEGSTRLLQELGEGYRAVQDGHLAIMREAIAAGDGLEIRTEGDAFFAVFTSAPGAVRATVQAQRAFADHLWPNGRPLRVRMGLHTGEGRLGGDDYLGIDVNRAARIAAAGHGGQVLLSEATRAIVQGDLEPGVDLRDLGRHRLKDLRASEHLHQLVIEGLPADFAPLRTLESPTNLPAELTSFVGRESEIEAVDRLLQRHRLVTLTGPGGSGKTRLSLRVAARALPRYADGVFFVELASVSDPELVPSAVAGALGIREEGPRPLLETLRSELRDRTALLVLDNFEQVIGAAPLVTDLLGAAPGLRIVATSRGPLHVQGERDHPVVPLELPDLDALPPAEVLARMESVALFADRAAAVDPSFVLDEENARAVAEICARLDGLPLAIELAASRVRLLPPAALRERLERTLPLLGGTGRDVPARQRTLRGAIAWSHDLLAPEAAVLYRRLSVFAGGFTLEAAEAVAGPDDGAGLDLLGTLESLLDVGLVRGGRGGTRFDLLQTIREFGEERLAQAGEGDEVRRRHAAHFLQLAEAASGRLRGPDYLRHLELLELEHDNLRGALTWAIEGDHGEPALRLLGALWRFWHLRGHLTSGRRWAEEVLALPSAAGRTATRARALWGAAGLAYWQTDPDGFRRPAEEALAIAEELADPPVLALATYHAAFRYPFENDPVGMREALGRALDLFEAVGNRRGVADVLFVESILDRLEGRLEPARLKAERALAIHRELGDAFGMTGSLFALGRVAAEQGDLDLARSLVLESLALCEQMDDRTGVAIALDNLADQEGARGRYRRAVRLGGASAAIKEAVGGEAPPAMVHLPDPREGARGHLGEPEIAAAWEEGRAMSLDRALAHAREDGSGEDRAGANG